MGVLSGRWLSDVLAWHVDCVFRLTSLGGGLISRAGDGRVADTLAPGARLEWEGEWGDSDVARREERNGKSLRLVRMRVGSALGAVAALGAAGVLSWVASYADGGSGGGEPPVLVISNEAAPPGPLQNKTSLDRRNSQWLCEHT